MKIAISLGNSNIGRLVVEALLAKCILPGDLVAIVRSLAKVSDLKEQGLEIREATYGDEASFERALAGVDKMYMVSGMAGPEERIVQHRSVIDAAGKAGVRHVIFTSFIDTVEGSPFFAWTVNQDTEAHLKASGMAWTILRNGMYSEADLDYIPSYLEAGKVENNIGDGKISYISRRDLALAAAHCLLDTGHENQTYALTGPEAVTQAELAARISRWTGKDIPYVAISDDAYREAFPEPHWAELIVTLYQAVRLGHMAAVSGDFEKIVGRNAYTLDETYTKYCG